MTGAGNKTVEEIIANLPEALQGNVSLWAERFFAVDESTNDVPRIAVNQLGPLLRLIATSDFAARVSRREQHWLREALAHGEFDAPVEVAKVRTYIDESCSAGADEDSIRSRFRRCRNRQLLHILWRVVAGTDNLKETLASLSDLADTLIEAAVACSGDLLENRFGMPRNSDGEPIPMVVIAMGKLGGHELNFSSDVDLIFLYRDEGETDGPRAISAHEYFARRVRKVVSLLDDVTEDGFVYRVDTRLRPFGDSGPPVTSFAALESYLLQHARGWERYAYVKARVVSPLDDQRVVDELINDIIEPFVYRQYLDFGVFESLREMKALISAEVKKREMASNVKLGPGGIREIEFITQSLQLVRGGRDLPLRSPELQKALPLLANGKGLATSAVTALEMAYEFLRRLENAIQAIHDRQTHELPQDVLDQQRLTLAMNYRSWSDLLHDLETQRREVASHFATLLFSVDEESASSSLSLELTGLWDRRATATEWHTVFRENNFREPEALAETIGGFANEAIHRRLDRTAQRRLSRFIPILLLSLRDRPSPKIVLERVIRVVTQIVRRSAYVSLLNENPAALGRLIGLCEDSFYLAQEIARYPLLLDELLDPRRYAATISAEDMRDDLGARLQNMAPGDSERQIEVLGEFQRAALFRIAVVDHSGSLPIMQVSDRLTELAELVLNRALEIAWSDLVQKHGTPRYFASDGEHQAGFAVIAYGKLGGMELSYRSDLDLVFLHDSCGAKQETDGNKPLDNSRFFVRLVQRLIHLLTTQTASGVLYEVDTRLRPSGRSGLLVSSVEGFERYLEGNAWTWEHQALLRSRMVAGSGTIAREFERIRTETLRYRVHREQLLEDVLTMRARMRAQLDKSNEEQFDLKQGAGGIGDIEFLVQYLVLRNAREQPAVVHYSDNIRQLGTLAATGCLAETDVLQLQEIYKTYRYSLHRLALDERPPLVSNDDFTEQRQLVVRIWQRELVDKQGKPPPLVL